MPAAYTSELAEELAADVLDRFLRYVRVDTQSARDRRQSPSTPGQLDLARHARRRAAGDRPRRRRARRQRLRDGDAARPPTARARGRADRARRHEPGRAGRRRRAARPPRPTTAARIELPRGGTVLDPAEMPVLAGKAGHDVVTSSGDTLLGADDKAGVAEIMAAVAYLAAHPELPRPDAAGRLHARRGDRRGRDAVRRRGASAPPAPTRSTAPSSASSRTRRSPAPRWSSSIHGVDVHPGLAKGKLVNAARLAGAVLAALPADRLTPETTAEPRGLHPPFEVVAATRGRARRSARSCATSTTTLLAEHIALLRRTAERGRRRASRARALEVERQAAVPQHAPLRRHVPAGRRRRRAGDPRARGSSRCATPIRGGTDGSILSAKGLPTPNLFTGGHEYHSVREWASVQDMASAAAVVVRLAGLWAEEPA